MREYDYIIIGAGVTGLGAATYLDSIGADYLIIDKEQTAGGLAGSETTPEGFTFDYGGHVQFSHYEEFDRAQDKANKHGWNEIRRQSHIYTDDGLIPYPYQNNLHCLPMDKCTQSVYDLEGAMYDQWGIGDNFEEWILNTFGESIARDFMLPYNAKVWATDLRLMSHDWISDRVAIPDIEAIKHSIEFGINNDSWGDNSTFRYPKVGGTGGVYRQMLADLKGEFMLGVKVEHIINKNCIHLSTGQIVSGNNILSTMPIVALARMMNIKHADLHWNRTHIIGIGFEGEPPEHMKDKNWMYFAQEDVPFNRATVLSNYSDDLVPDSSKHWSLMFEVSMPMIAGGYCNFLMNECWKAATRLNMIEGSAPISTFYKYLPYGYPVPTLGRDKALWEIHAKLEMYNIESRGRFGSWLYEQGNMDHSFNQGWEWAKSSDVRE